MCTICTTQKGVEIARYNGVTTCYNGVTIEKKHMDHHADEATAFRQYMLLGPPMSFFEYAGAFFEYPHTPPLLSHFHSCLCLHALLRPQ